MTLLVVEDDTQTRAAIAFVFTRAGWTVRRAATLHEAREHMAPPEPDAPGWRPDVILADLRIPGSHGTIEDGVQLLDVGIPLVIFSGLDRRVDGALLVIRKPCGMADLVQRVTEALAFERPLAVR